jgi:hypothetical protein
MKGLTAQNQEVQMIIDENFQISHILGMPVHGLIGFNLFKDYIVEIDYINEKLTLNKPEYYKYRDRKKDIIMPLNFDGNKPFVNTSILTDDSNKVPVKLLLILVQAMQSGFRKNRTNGLSIPKTTSKHLSDVV